MKKLAMMMRIKLNGESLNNEGSIGNVLQTRQINLEDGLRDAISGDMLKHYHTRNLTLLSEDDELCGSCKIFSSMKDGKVEIKNEKLSILGNKIKNCIVDDVEGFALMESKPILIRSSCIKFSWAISTKESNCETFIKNRVDTVVKENTDQMILHSPLRSNEYAITVQVDLDRIGLDESTCISGKGFENTLDENEILNRKRKTMRALRNMFIDMEGALCSTKLPHITNIEGIIVEKHSKEDVLVKYSALKDDYIEVNSKLATHSKVFRNVEEFCNVMDSLI